MNEIAHCRYSLSQLGLVDSDPEAPFDNLTALAASMLGAPVSLVSIVEFGHDRQFFKSQRGVPEPWASRRQTPLSHSFCQHVVRENAPLVVENAPEHPLVRDNRAIPELGVTAYLGVPIYDPVGIPVGALCVIEGQRRAWSEANLETLSKLAACVSDAIRLKAEIMAGEELRAEQREFTYAISHDLRAPANTLHLLLNELTALRDGDADEDVAELLALSQNTIARMGCMIDDVLNYTRVIGGDPQLEPVDLAVLVGEILEDLKGDIRCAGGSVEVGDLPVYTGNRMQLRVLLQNLIANALKFRKPGVAPVVSIGAGIAPQSSHLRLVVTDNGIGIAAENHEKVFKLFQRLHVREEYPGTGLGLSLCQRIARNHGGEITLRSALGEGSEFTVLLERRVT